MAIIPRESKFIDRFLGRPLTGDDNGALSGFNPVLHLTYTSRRQAPANGHAARTVVIDWASSTGRGRPAWKESLSEAVSASSNYDAIIDETRLRMMFDLSGSYWTFRMEHPDYRITERRWRLDAFVAERGNVDEMGIRLSCLPGNEHRVAATTPRIVRSWLELGILNDGGRRLTPQPWFPADAEFDDLLALLHSPFRSLPVVVVSERVPRHGAASFPVPPGQLAKMIPGLAHVVAVSSALSSRLTLEVGKSHSVFQGAVRSYMPGFSPESDRFVHPLYRPHNTDARSSGAQMSTQKLMGMIAARLRSETVKADVPREWQEFDRVLGRRSAPDLLARLRGAFGFSARA